MIVVHYMIQNFISLKEAFSRIKNPSVMVSALEFTSTANLNVSFNNVSLLKSNWTINGLNLFLCKVSLAKTEIRLSLMKRDFWYC